MDVSTFFQPFDTNKAIVISNHFQYDKQKIKFIQGDSSKMKAAYIPVGAGGHIITSLPMVGELVKKGVEVDYYAPESFREQIELTGARHCVFPDVTECYSNPYMAKEEFLAVIPLVFLGQAKEALDTIMKGLKESKPDFIIADALALAGRLAAWKLKLPIVFFFSTYMPCKDFSIYRTWPSYPDSPAREAAAQMAAEFQQEYGGRLLTPEEIFEGTGDLNICTLTREFQPAGDTFGEEAFFAGAQIAPRAGDDTWMPPDNNKPLLYTSLGSLFNYWPEFYRMLFPVVREMDINVLCSVGRRTRPEELGEIPDNVTVMPFTPQLEVLKHTDYFITHAGTGGVMEAMYFGVPCLCIPQMDEQVFTAHRLMALGGASGVLDKRAINPEALHEAIENLINSKQCRKNALAMSRRMKSDGGCERAAQAVLDFAGKRV